jgi:hypothetical protein
VNFNQIDQTASCRSLIPATIRCRHELEHPGW